MLTAPAAMLAKILGTKNGDSRLSFPSTCMWTSSTLMKAMIRIRVLK